MSILNIFRRKPKKFIQLLVQQTNLTAHGLALLKTYMEKRDHGVAVQISRIEKDADEIRRILIEELMRRSVTRFDRGDIFAISREVDDVLDYANTTVDEMEILDVPTTPYMLRMASLLNDAAQEIDLAVQRLQSRHYAVASDHAQRAKALENRVETVYREAISDLFTEPKNLKQLMTIMKVREVYRHLSNMADREDAAANAISDVIMKVS